MPRVWLCVAALVPGPTSEPICRTTCRRCAVSTVTRQKLWCVAHSSHDHWHAVCVQLQRCSPRRALQAAIHEVYVTLKMSALEAQRVYLSFCQKLPEYGARFFVGKMFRNVSSRGEGTGNPARTPPSWLHDTRRESGLDVLLGINPAGVHVRPAPPVHDQRYKRASAAAGGVREVACVCWPGPHKAWRVCARAWWCVHATALRGVDVLSPWYLHPTRHIEVWGTKNRRPVLTYRVREARVMDVQVHSPSVRESMPRCRARCMASWLPMLMCSRRLPCVP